MIKFDIIPIWVKILVLAALFAGTWGHGFYRGGKDKQADWDADKVKTLEATAKREKELRDKNDKVSEELQTALKNVRIEYITVTDTVTKEVAGKIVYKECKVPESGVKVMQSNAERLNNLRTKQ